MPPLAPPQTTEIQYDQKALASRVFHNGEAYLQAGIDFRQNAEEWYGDFIRTAMPDQHRQFFQNLPYMVMGAISNDTSSPSKKAGRPWATLLTGPTGFVNSPNATSLVFNLPNSSISTPGKIPDPAIEIMNSRIPNPLSTPASHTDETAHVGFLGIEFHTRRRNRMNGQIASVEQTPSGGLKMSVKVVQSFGNCPKYIQARSISGPRSAPSAEEAFTDHVDLEADSEAKLTERMVAVVENSDTMFIASRYLHPPNNGEPNNSSGVDVSHRGGNKGFIRVLNERRAIAWPDYKGNNMFMTLGNILKDPRAGVLIPDFESGHIFQATGRARILTGAEATSIFPTMQRATIFEIDECILRSHALPYTFKFLDNSPYNPAVRSGNGSGEAVTMAQMVSIRPEAKGIATFRFKLLDESEGIKYVPGQNVTFDFSEDEMAKQFKTAFKDMAESQIIEGKNSKRKRDLEKVKNAEGLLERLKGDDMIRTWTITSVPELDEDGTSFKSSTEFTVTVKHIPNGLMSSLLHYFLSEETPMPPITVKGVGGEIFPQVFQHSPDDDHSSLTTLKDDTKILFLGAGIGLTPLVGLVEGLKHARLSLQSQNRLSTTTQDASRKDIVAIVSFSTLDDVPIRFLKSLLDATTSSYFAASASPTPKESRITLEIILHISNLPADAQFPNLHPSLKIRPGRVTKETFEEKIREVDGEAELPSEKKRRVVLCGPPGYMETAIKLVNGVKDVLDSESMVTESFAY
ncbi:hypothetical protein HDU97_005727 [Phlyctochytrium planicorne]|nr:hypothetical protein HDU97_005727 [Phlyctochytrium planicorne]